MNIYLFGTDTFRSRQQLKKMINKFKVDRDPQGMNVVILDCMIATGPEIMEQLFAIPFLAEKRMVVLENLISATGKKDVQTSVHKRLEEKSIPDTTVVIFWEGKNKAKTDVAKKMHKLLTREKFAQEFLELKGVHLSQWIAYEVQNRGGKIARQAVQYIVQHVGSDMWQLHSLVDQLTSYTSAEIGVADVKLFLDETSDDSIFNLVDAIVAGQSKKVYHMIRQQYASGEDAMFILSMLIRQFRILLQMRDLYDRDDAMCSDMMAKQLGLHPFVVKKSLPFIKKYNSDALKKIFEKLREIDIKTKTGQGDQKMLLDLFVGTMTVC